MKSWSDTKTNKGKNLARASTEKPFYIESTEGLSEFTVPTSLITSMNE